MKKHGRTYTEPLILFVSSGVLGCDSNFLSAYAEVFQGCFNMHLYLYKSEIRSLAGVFYVGHLPCGKMVRMAGQPCLDPLNHQVHYSDEIQTKALLWVSCWDFPFTCVS